MPSSVFTFFEHDVGKPPVTETIKAVFSLFRTLLLLFRIRSFEHPTFGQEANTALAALAPNNLVIGLVCLAMRLVLGFGECMFPMGIEKSKTIHFAYR